jgi:hypothetical protein
MRPTIKYRDVEMTEVIAMNPSDGWLAEVNGGTKPVMFWLLLKDGGLVGLVSEMPIAIAGELRAADKLPGFSGYRRAAAGIQIKEAFAS